MFLKSNCSYNIEIMTKNLHTKTEVRKARHTCEILKYVITGMTKPKSHLFVIKGRVRTL